MFALVTWDQAELPAFEEFNHVAHLEGLVDRGFMDCPYWASWMIRGYGGLLEFGNAIKQKYLQKEHHALFDHNSIKLMISLMFWSREPPRLSNIN